MLLVLPLGGEVDLNGVFVECLTEYVVPGVELIDPWIACP
jgi:hypothetical protein